MGGIGIWQLVIVLVIVLLIVLLIVFLLFGTKRLKGLGSDVGEAIQGFRKSMGNQDERPVAPETQVRQPQPTDRQA